VAVAAAMGRGATGAALAVAMVAAMLVRANAQMMPAEVSFPPTHLG